MRKFLSCMVVASLMGLTPALAQHGHGGGHGGHGGWHGGHGGWHGGHGGWHGGHGGWHGWHGGHWHRGYGGYGGGGCLRWNGWQWVNVCW